MSLRHFPLKTAKFYPLMKHIRTILFFSYTGLLTYIVFFSRRRQSLVWSNKLVNLVPIKHTIQSFRRSDLIGLENNVANLLGNIIIFVPLAFFLVNIFGIYTKKKIIAVGFLISFFIEFIQFILKIGVPDIDDILLNVTGVIIGIYVYKILWIALKNQPR
ncbi:VanZ family protein [uncultured Hymenobacter sp.]|uniref:VanZ family protein n=1 Tax=uncultured Hymenobacter sp. TaxID=170016 RepID=UPI0035CC5049